VADAVMLAVSKRLAPRFVPPGASSQLQVQVQGMNLQRYAELAACWNLGPRCRWLKAYPDLRVTAVVISCVRSWAWPSCRSAGEQAPPAGLPAPGDAAAGHPPALQPSRSTACVFAGKGAYMTDMRRWIWLGAAC
jgi:hypothetical protein